MCSACTLLGVPVGLGSCRAVALGLCEEQGRCVHTGSEGCWGVAALGLSPAPGLRPEGSATVPAVQLRMT